MNVRLQWVPHAFLLTPTGSKSWFIDQLITEGTAYVNAVRKLYDCTQRRNNRVPEVRLMAFASCIIDFSRIWLDCNVFQKRLERKIDGGFQIIWDFYFFQAFVNQVYFLNC